MKNYFQPNAPDSGPWIYCENKQMWIEPNLSKHIDWVNWPVRKTNQDTTNVFFIDGFPRQATNTLRRLILECFETVSIIDNIEHMFYPFELFSNDGKNCFLTIRDPFNAISSTYGYTKAEINNIEILDSIIKYYIRMTSIPFTVKEITVVEFEDIINNPYNLLLKIKNKFSLNSKNIESYINEKNTKAYDQNHNFTQKQNVIEFLKENIDRLEECYDIYNKISKEKI